MKKPIFINKINSVVFRNRRMTSIVAFAGIFALIGLYLLTRSSAATGVTVIIRARGQTGTEQMQISINQVPLQTWNLTNTAFQDFTYVHPTSINDKDIRINFLNDGKTEAGADRNVEVDHIKVNGSVFQSEAANVYSEGSVTSTTGCAAGYKLQQWLHCPMSYFQYSIGSVGLVAELGSNTAVVPVAVTARGRTGQESLELRINKIAVKKWTLTTSNALYSYAHTSTINDKDISLHFINSVPTTDGINRDVFVDYITVNSVTFQTETNNVSSKGSWSATEGCAVGNKQSEWLNCYGENYFQYSIGISGVLINTPTTTPPPTTVNPKVTIAGKGVTGQEKIELKIKDVAVKSWVLTTAIATYDYTHNSTIGDKDIKVAFVNDGMSSTGVDMNAHVDFIKVNSTQFETEASTVYSLGAWNSATGCGAGYKQLVWLNCNGYFQYSIGAAGGSSETAPAPAPSPTPTPTPPPTTTTQGPRGDVNSYQTVTGPVVLLAGQTLKNKRISNPTGNCVEINSQNGAQIIIEDVVIGPCGKSGVLGVHASNVTVRYAKFKDIATLSSPSAGTDEAAVQFLKESANLYFGYSIIEDVRDKYTGAALGEHRGFFLDANNGSKAAVSNIIVEHNYAKNTGRNFAQLVDVYGSGILIQNNRVENVLGSSTAEDFINVFGSSGTASSYLTIKANYLRNGGPSKTGSGIMLGDEGASGIGGNYQTAIGNVLVRPGQVGIGIYGGENNIIDGNKIYSDVQSFTNVGMYVWKSPVRPASGDPCQNHTIKNNTVKFFYGIAGGSHPVGTANNFWNAGNCGTIAGESTNTLGANISDTIWNQ